MIAAGNDVIWIPGFRPAHAYEAEPGSTECVVVTMMPRIKCRCQMQDRSKVRLEPASELAFFETAALKCLYSLLMAKEPWCVLYSRP